ncbi:MAG: DUF1761 domain-containing protein [Gammaproteobacteria bacterium]|nr:DUF1761 domain-containing protein [Gammaproteobacteria bacterium]NND60371.1 DUF1761 domain-containing protein [Gammaproteobacteria bacterium]
MPDVNYLAVILAAVSSFVIGGLWYSPVLFEKAWTADAGVGKQDGHAPTVFGISFLFTLVSATAFAVWLGPEPQLQRAVVAGLIVGTCFVAASFGVNYQFAQRSFRLLLIDGGYHTLQFLLYGLILGLWH